MVDLKLQIPDSFYAEEVRSGFTVTEDRKKLWAVQLDLLNEFERVCREYGLTYYADGGTALGAVRHNGFIPWDDDVDLAMFRKDFNRLCEIAPEAFSEPYFFQTEHTDPGSMRCHAQLRNSMTSSILLSELELKLPFNQGIFIDIFPLDNMPDDGEKRESFVNNVKKNRKLAAYYARLTSRFRKCPWSFRECLFRACHALMRGTDNPFYNRFEEYAQKYPESTGEVALLCLPVFSESFIWKRSWYREVVMMPFEMLKVPVCIDYDAYLTRHYGDWKTPVIRPSLHGGMFVDTEKPYTDYLLS